MRGANVFTIRFVTDTVIPDTNVVFRTSVDNWADRAGEYVNGAWQFVLDERAVGRDAPA